MGNLSETNCSQPLKLKSAKALLDSRYSFYVPGYQRGYRWRPKEIEVLINDLQRFGYEEDRKEEKERCPFYCLQALYLKETKEHGLEVIDGQQRLTSVLIILQAIHTIREWNSFKQSIIASRQGYNLQPEWVFSTIYSMKYETREDSSIWLMKITKAYVEDCINDNEDECNKLRDANSDYYHFVEAYKTAIRILNNLDPSELGQFENILCKKTRFIWFDSSLVGTTDTDVDLFDRINATKINLNNAELIKALFLQTDNFGTETHERDQLAIDWDRIEKQLQEPSFWGFIYSTRHPFSYLTHIEYIFDLLKKKTAVEEDYYYFTFNCYYNDFPQEINERLDYVKKCWDEVQKMMLTLEEWYSDRSCYHYIGYLLEYGLKEGTDKPITIPYLLDKLSGITKDQRIGVLKKMIRYSLRNLKSTQLFYKHDELTQVLFLLNIQTEENRNNETARFSFSDYKEIKKKPTWNQEHVASHVDYSPKYEDRKGLAFALLEYFTGVPQNDDLKTYKKKVSELMPEEKEAQSLCENLLDFFDEKIDDTKISKVYDNVLDYFDTKGDDEFIDSIPVGRGTIEEKNFIWNFVLLNATTNMSYGNSIFPLKRQRIMRDEDCIYTPVCTRAVFEKAYSNKLTNLMTWGRKDGIMYWKYICSCLSEFLPKDFSLPSYIKI